jgi:hypothetical protein
VEKQPCAPDRQSVGLTFHAVELCRCEMMQYEGFNSAAIAVVKLDPKCFILQTTMGHLETTIADVDWAFAGCSFTNMLLRIANHSQGNPFNLPAIRKSECHLPVLFDQPYAYSPATVFLGVSLDCSTKTRPRRLQMPPTHSFRSTERLAPWRDADQICRQRRWIRNNKVLGCL